MSRKNVVFLLVASLLLITAALSCKSSEPTPPKTTPPLSSEEQGTGKSEPPDPRFVITQPVTPAFTPTTITPTTVTPTTITPWTITPATIVPTTITPRTITPTTVTPATISPARDLVGTWRGTGVSYWLDGDSGDRIARTTWDLTLIITEQTGNDVKGTLTMNTIKQEPLVAQDFPINNYGPDKLENGREVSSNLYFNIGDWYWGFSLTTDTMSGQYGAPGAGKPCDLKAFTLKRQW
jgi:hypothetical protein